MGHQDAAFMSSRAIHIVNVLQQQKLELNESIKRNPWLSLRDTSPWRATNSEECDVVRCN